MAAVTLAQPLNGIYSPRVSGFTAEIALQFNRKNYENSLFVYNCTFTIRHITVYLLLALCDLYGRKGPKLQ